MSDTPFNKVAADLIKSSMELIEQILLKHANAVLEEMHDQIVKRNTRISDLERELSAAKTKLAPYEAAERELPEEPSRLSSDPTPWFEYAIKLRDFAIAQKVRLATCKQAIMEMDHAHFSPNWFTKGVDGANSQFILWRDRAIAALNEPKT